MRGVKAAIECPEPDFQYIESEIQCYETLFQSRKSGNQCRKAVSQSSAGNFQCRASDFYFSLSEFRLATFERCAAFFQKFGRASYKGCSWVNLNVVTI